MQSSFNAKLDKANMKEIQGKNKLILMDIIKKLIQSFESRAATTGAKSNNKSVDTIIQNLIKLVSGINIKDDGSNNTDVTMVNFDVRLTAFVNIIQNFDFFNKNPLLKFIF